MRPTCNRWLDEKGDRCNAPAEYIVYGKFFPPDNLGPRCGGCFGEENPIVRLYQLDQYAVYKLPTQPTKETYTREQLEDVVAGLALQASEKRSEAKVNFGDERDVPEGEANAYHDAATTLLAALDTIKGKGGDDG